MSQLRICPAEGSALPSVPGSRRQLLQCVAAAAFALGLGQIDSSPWAEAKKRKKRKKRRKSCGGSTPAPITSYSPDSEERAFLDLINAYHQQKGVGALTLNNQLGAAAEFHSQDMARNTYVQHTLSNCDSSVKNIERHDYTRWIHVGENIAAGMTTAEEVFAGWQISESHRKNMQNGHYKEIGIGRAYNENSRWGWYWTTTFGQQ